MVLVCVWPVRSERVSACNSRLLLAKESVRRPASASVLFVSANVGVLKVEAEYVIVLVDAENTFFVERILPKDAAIREVKADRAVGVASDFNYLSLSFKALVGDVRQSFWHPFWEQNFVRAFEL